jgi:predicted phage tail protein
MSLNAPTVADAMKLIEVNNDNFRGYLIDAHEKGVGFHIDVAGQEIEYDEELLLPLHEGDITITPVPAGAKGGGKILAAILIAVVAFYAMPYLIAGANMTVGAGGLIVTGSTGLGTALTVAQYALYGIATSLAMSGLAEMMAPDPATDADQQSSYLFNGSEKNVVEGDPVPVLYGKLRIPGQPVSFEISNVSSSYSMTTDYRGTVQQEVVEGVDISGHEGGEGGN